ncbi:hypothetical protein HDC92_002215 [Pedobacter sp. AK017]|uniref:hypothetical protein n=1 Tax=Pedobacter sp. AK017 TaxID=2723073 RepID=UPI00160C8C23|nr:hypothetical protein [Pedobacter sp. AK017]MBB5438539.1 hypothetical protein [Pedobacter sp. AK017]
MTFEPVIPNFYSFKLKVNARLLTIPQKRFFFDCINKIYYVNDKVVYRGTKRSQLQSVYGLQDSHFASEFRYPLFTLGAKATMFGPDGLPGINEIEIAQTGSNMYKLLFRMLSNLLNREFPFSATRNALKTFRANEQEVAQYFRNQNNERHFLDRVGTLTQRQKIYIRDHYLALLHHVSKSEYYNSSFLLSATSSFRQAHRFAWKDEAENSENPLILFGWVPKNYEGLLSTPRSSSVRSKIDVDRLGLPIYHQSFFPWQQEVTLKGGLLPHYTLGYLYYQGGALIFEINPALFATDETWNGRELPVDQSTFHQRIRNTIYGKYFSMDENANFQQHRV